MNTMALTRPAELRACRLRLTPGPAAAAEARAKVLAAVDAWDLPVDGDVAAVLTSDLVTYAIRHAVNEALTLGIRCLPGQVRVEVHQPARSPASAAEQADAARHELALISRLSAEWGFQRTIAGTAVFYALPF